MKIITTHPTDSYTLDMDAKNKKVAVLCVDPSSPFNLGALLGDRIRMSDWYNNPNVFIRSLATSYLSDEPAETAADPTQTNA